MRHSDCLLWEICQWDNIETGSPSSALLALFRLCYSSHVHRAVRVLLKAAEQHRDEISADDAAAVFYFQMFYRRGNDASVIFNVLGKRLLMMSY